MQCFAIIEIFCHKSKFWLGISCGHTADIYRGETDVPRENYLNSPVINLSWVSISQDQKFLPTFFTSVWVEDNKTAKRFGAQITS